MRWRTMILRASVLASALGAFFLVAAVSVSAQEGPRVTVNKTKRNTITLKVENDNYLDMHIYGVRDDYYVPLGTVTGFTKTEIAIPSFLTTPGSDFQIFADPIGAWGGYRTPDILLGTENEIDLTIEGYLPASHYMIRMVDQGSPTGG